MQASFSNRSFARLTLVFSFIFLLAGCQQQAVERLPSASEPFRVAGQVFVVTTEGGSVTLGSVRVQVFEEDSVTAHLESKEQEIAAWRSEQRDRLRELEQQAEAQLRRKAEAERGYAERLEAMRDEVAALNAAVGEKTATLQKQIHSNRDFIEFVSAFPAPPEGVPLRSEYDVYVARRAKWLGMSANEREAWETVLTNLNGELQEEQQRLKEDRDRNLAGFEEELQALSEKISAADQQRAEIAAKVEEAKAKLNQPPEPSVYLAGMPEPLKETRTDAGGEFRIEFESPRDCVVLVQAQRQVNGEQLDLTWLVRVDERERGRLLLSNHNLIGTNSSENLVEFTAPDPEASS